MKKSCLIIAGEKSGEEHVLSFFSDLKKKCPDYDFFGVGGDLLADEMELLYHLKDFSSWGISEVIFRIPFYLNALKRIEDECLKRGTKSAILVDFQSFNMKLAKRLKKRGVQILYYVAPQAWAWKAWRTQALANYTDKLFTILPFEKEWFKSRGVSQVVSVPHPLYYQHLKQQLAKTKNLNTKNLDSKDLVEKNKKSKKLLLLPGSRNFEVDNLLSTFIHVSNSFEGEVALVCSSNVSPKYYEMAMSLSTKPIKIFYDKDISKSLEWADLSLAASGTVTLHCALYCVPTIVCYKGSLLNQWVFENLVSYRGFISLANIVHQKEVFPEFIQDRVTDFNLKKSLNKLLNEDFFQMKKKELALTFDKIKGDVDNVGDFIGALVNKGER